MIYRDRDRHPLSLPEYMDKFQDLDYRMVEVTMISKGEESCRVSTVWLGIDDECCQDEGTIFETMIFGGSLNGWERRYATEWEAISGHAEAVKMIQES